jgi:Ribbon-helix-helix protein, copG family
MQRIQAQLSEETARRLKALSAQEGVSVAELLRRGAELVLRQGPNDTPEERKRRARAVVGRFSDAPDVAANHDEHLDRAFDR